jgi:hypothetical protein
MNSAATLLKLADTPIVPSKTSFKVKNAPVSPKIGSIAKHD